MGEGPVSTAGDKIKDIVFGQGNVVELMGVEDGALVYRAISKGHRPLEFRIPHEDLRGASFKLHDSPKLFMRWIRKAVLQEEQDLANIEQERKDAAEGKGSYG